MWVWLVFAVGFAAGALAGVVVGASYVALCRGVHVEASTSERWTVRGDQ